MMSGGATRMTTAKRTFVLCFGCVLGLVGVLSDARPAFAQDCPRPAGVADNPLATPSPSAGEVAAGAGDLGDFARAAR